MRVPGRFLEKVFIHTETRGTLVGHRWQCGKCGDYNEDEEEVRGKAIKCKNEKCRVMNEIPYQGGGA